MRRAATVLISLTFLAAACGQPAEVADAGFAPPAEGLALAYGYSAQSEVDYRFGMSLDMTATMEGLDGAPGAPEGPVEMGIDAAGDIGYAIAPGAEPGTNEITLNVGFDSLDIREMSIGGESMADQIPADEMDAVFETEGLIPEMTVVVDERGNLLSMSYGDQELPAGLLGGDPFGGSALPGGGIGPETLFGPPFPADKLSVGSTWTVAEQRDLPFGPAVDVTTEYRVAGTEVVRGRNLWVIEATTRTGDIDIDLADMMASLGSDPELEAAGFDAGEMADAYAALADGMDMKFRIKPKPTRSTTWFDADAGLVVKTFGEGRVALEMEMAMFGETMNIDMTMDMSMVMELQDRDPA